MMKKIVYLLLFLATVAIETQANGAVDESGPKDRKPPFSTYSNEIILKWNEIAFETMSGPTYDPMIGSRIMAMVHIAMHDALNNIEPVYETYGLQREDKTADPIAAVSAAAHAVLVASFPDKKSQLDLALNDAIKDLKSVDAKEKGLTQGADAGKAIFKMRSNDGAFADPIAPVNNPATPGLYQAVPPTPFLYAPFWATLPTFGLKSPAQFRVSAMPSLTSKEYTKAFNEVKLKGVKEKSTRTSEETFIAKFWYEFSEIGWNRVAVTAARNKNLDLLTTARLLALVNIGMADGYIAGWDSKFYHNFWRPYTAVRLASTDNNDLTTEDATWEPLMNTPPVHDFPSTHAVLGNSAATILAGIVGNNVGFTMTSTSSDPAATPRTFKSFSQAALENAESRVFAGIHFRFSSESGLRLGKDIGNWVLENQLKLKPAAKKL